MSTGRYKRISKDPYQNEEPPVPKKPNPNEAQYLAGTYTRYFLRHKSDHSVIMEIDKNQFETLHKKDEGINGSIYQGFKLKWRIRGRLHDEYNGGVRTYPGVYESNQRFTEKLKKSFPEIENIVRNFTERARIEGSTSSTILTSNVNDHFHYVFIDSMGNGHTSEYVNPKNPNINHYHEIRNFVIQEAQDGCYPNCFTVFGYQGIGPHTHEIIQ